MKVVNIKEKKMKCPVCKELIEYRDIVIERPADQRSDFFDISICCSNDHCRKEFFCRVNETDLILDY